MSFININVFFWKVTVTFSKNIREKIEKYRDIMRYLKKSPTRKKPKQFEKITLENIGVIFKITHVKTLTLSRC